MEKLRCGNAIACFLGKWAAVSVDKISRKENIGPINEHQLDLRNRYN